MLLITKTNRRVLLNHRLEVHARAAHVMGAKKG